LLPQIRPQPDPLAANGYEDGARNDARLLSAKQLLPEERENLWNFL
jgi:hypothetical protein